MTDPTRPIQVLMVEDNPADTRLVEELLLESGHVFHLIQVGRLAKAWPYLDESQVDCVLLDLGLPDSLGLEGLVRIREAAPEVPIVVLTGRDEGELSAGAFERGADDYLVKGSVDAAVLARSIRHAVTRRKSQETVDRSARALVQELYTEAPNAHFSTGVDGRTQRVNRSAAELLGYEPDELIGGSVLDLVADTPEGRGTAQEIFKRFIAGEKVHDQELEMRAKDGRSVWVSLSMHPILDSDGRVVASSTVAFDISHRKAALIESEERYRRLVETSPDGIFVQSDLKFVHVNPTAARILGADSPDDLVGRTIMDFVHPAHRELDVQRIETVQSGSDIGLVETRLVTLGGDVFDAEVWGLPIMYEGSPALQVMFRDVSDRKVTEEALRGNEARHRALLEGVPDMIFRVSGQGEYLDFEAGIGVEPFLPADKFLGRHMTEVMPPEVAEGAMDVIRRALEGGKPQTWEYELPVPGYLWDGGEDVPPPVQYFESRCVPVVDEHEVVFIVRDVTDRRLTERALTESVAEVRERAKQLEQHARELELANIELESVNAELDRFAHAVAHDLSEPLRTISSYVKLLATRYRDELDSAADEFIDFTVQGVARMKARIDDLVTFAEVGTKPWPSEPVNCEAVVEETLQLLKPALVEAEATVSVDPLPTVLGSAVELGGVFQNLITNAIKFTPPEVSPQVRISAIRKDDAWWFTVADNGIGILPEHTDRIFDMFERLHGPDEYPGTGAGLAICKRIVERAGGEIWVESIPGRGSTFTFTIQAQEA